MSTLNRSLAVLVAVAAALVALVVPTTASASTGDVFASWSIGPDTFYPLVQDGYRDSVAIAWDAKTDGTEVSIEVKDAGSGELVNGWVDSGDGTRSWYGYRIGGARASEGNYVVTLTGDDKGTGAHEVQTTTVTLASGVVTDHFTKVKTGDHLTYYTRQGRCYVHRRWAMDETGLACNGYSNYARVKAVYRFFVPADAQNVTWRVVGDRDCCGGSVGMWGTRPVPEKVKVNVRVMKTAQYTIYRVRIRYDVQRAI